MQTLLKVLLAAAVWAALLSLFQEPPVRKLEAATNALQPIFRFLEPDGSLSIRFVQTRRRLVDDETVGDDDDAQDLSFYRKSLPLPVPSAAFKRRLQELESSIVSHYTVFPDDLPQRDTDKHSCVLPAILVGIASAVSVVGVLLMCWDVRRRLRLTNFGHKPSGLDVNVGTEESRELSQPGGDLEHNFLKMTLYKMHDPPSISDMPSVESGDPSGVVVMSDKEPQAMDNDDIAVTSTGTKSESLSSASSSKTNRLARTYELRKVASLPCGYYASEEINECRDDSSDVREDPCVLVNRCEYASPARVGANIDV